MVVVWHVEPGKMAALLMTGTLHGLGALPGGWCARQHDTDSDAFVDDVVAMRMHTLTPTRITPC